MAILSRGFYSIDGPYRRFLPLAGCSSVTLLSLLTPMGMRSIALVLSLVMGFPAAWAASPGLPFTENFTDSSLQDSLQTNANWSPEQQAVYLQWRDHVRAGQANWPSTGPAVGSANTDLTTSIALGDVDR